MSFLLLIMSLIEVEAEMFSLNARSRSNQNVIVIYTNKQIKRKYIRSWNSNIDKIIFLIKKKLPSSLCNKKIIFFRPKISLQNFRKSLEKD